MSTEQRETSCKQRVREHYRSRIADIRRLWAAYRNDPDAEVEDLGTWDEYGLSFDYVPAHTFADQKRGYFRFQLSWGGPADEFRFYADETLNLTSVQYWFLDWFDGAHVVVNGRARELIEEIWQDWKDCELPQSKMAEALKE